MNGYPTTQIPSCHGCLTGAQAGAGADGTITADAAQAGYMQPAQTFPAYSPAAQPSMMPEQHLTQQQQSPLLAPTAPITPLTQPAAVTLTSTQYLNGYLRTQIGKRVNVEFLIGTSTLTDRTGTLVAVGANYIVINEIETDDMLVCDFYSIKFVRIYL